MMFSVGKTDSPRSLFFAGALRQPAEGCLRTRISWSGLRGTLCAPRSEISWWTTAGGPQDPRTCGLNLQLVNGGDSRLISAKRKERSSLTDHSNQLGRQAAISTSSRSTLTDEISGRSAAGQPHHKAL